MKRFLTVLLLIGFMGAFVVPANAAKCPKGTHNKGGGCAYN